jgi:hypothetical protein
MPLEIESKEPSILPETERASTAFSGETLSLKRAAPAMLCFDPIAASSQHAAVSIQPIVQKPDRREFEF